MKVQNPIRVVPSKSPVCANDFESVNGWTLEVIQMHTTHCPVLEFQPDFCNIFNIELKRRDMSIERPQGFDIAQHETQIIERMCERDNDTTA